MALKSKIEITFNADIPIGANFYFKLRWQYLPWVIDSTTDFNYTIVASRTSVFQVTQGFNPTVTPGERTAINFYEAFIADWSTIYQVSIASNKVIIITSTGATDMDGLFTWVIGSSVHEDVSMVITNVYDDSVEPPVIIEETLILNPISFKDFQIDIINTYTNESILVDEITQVASPVLKFDGGDTKYETLQSSSLTFNMQVADKQDAKFLHLFTGDEKQYRVELTAIDEDNNSVLYWKGFLLPEQFSEPYFNGVFFVEFTATDNLALQKNYTLKPWFFSSRYPLVKLLSYLLEETKLNQKIIIAPSLLPNQDNAMANMINVPIQQYKDKNKYKDNLEILTDVLESLGLTIYSFRGYWFIIGLSRKHELEVRFAEVYDVNGDFVEFARINRPVNDFFCKTKPRLNALPQLKKVQFQLDVDNRLNVFPNNLVKSDFKSSEYLSYGGFMSVPIIPERPIFIDKMVAFWEKVGTSNYRLFEVENTQFVYNISQPVETSHNMDETTALSNYFKPRGDFYVLENFKYTINIEATIFVKASAIPSSDDYPLYDKMLPVQLLLNGIEVFSKKPSNTTLNQKKYSHSVNDIVGGFEITFKLQDEIYFRQSGILEFRVLVPIWNNASGEIPSLIKFSKLELLEEEKNDYLEFIEATRNINNTIYLKKDLKFVSSSNSAIRNNYGIGYPSSSVYDHQFTSLNNGDEYIGYHTFIEGLTLGAVNRLLKLKGKDVDEDLLRVLFQEGYSEFVFIKNNISGDIQHFYSLYGNLVRNFIATYDVKIAYLYDYDVQCILPEGYKKFQENLNGYDFYYRKVNYNYEIMANRDNWTIVGQNTGSTFLKQLARIYMNTHCSTMMKLEGSGLEILQPDAIYRMYYNNEERDFVLTSISINLPEGQTEIVSAIEAIYQELTDITFE